MSSEQQKREAAANAPVSRHSEVHGFEQLKQENPKVSRGSLLVLVLIVLVVAAVLAIFGIARRKHEGSELAKYTDVTAAPPVALEKPALQQTAQEIVLPGNVQAFTLAPIYARTTGYVKTWSHDIGSHVRKGDLLAIIETPELDQQLAQAKADLATAQSNAALSKITASRYGDLIGKNAVSQQDTDNATNDLTARTTQVNSAQANVRRLEELVSFERIVAPFDGVVTARNIDIGQLISATGSTTTAGAGTVTASREIFDISANRTLRVFINVPQIYAPDATNGTLASLTLPQYPGRKFEGHLVRTSNAVDPATRTLLAEVDVDNKTGELLPGSYTEVHLHVSHSAPALIVPVNALILESDGLRIATVDSANHIRMVRVTPGRDFGSTVEILSGLEPGQGIVANPSDSLTDGQEVRVVNPADNKPAPTTGAK
ncbi:efflux RND transporter periplasmic adaptor subunit [Granulicella sp. WH15]|uniref:efflux RND transporter periplasmic adaptor subunit n=1 Tax=Granulicella sp. WH15 TaxID=2602070 RepID=UPI0013676F05|nr:efflux RND transporter periplasmic adaptor subunit [Granulicella sp. WH15]QHN05093.1 efflux RND transporter periplasmic adaptor subunit [Granulicella sp. WH15]